MERKRTANTATHVETVTLVELIGLLHTLELDASKRDYTCFAAPSEWSGNLSFNEALQCLEYGWDGAPPIQSITVPALADLAEDTAYFYDVTGETLDVAAYTSGEPEHWIQTVPTIIHGTKIIRLSLELNCSWRVTAAALRNRGQAIIALINSLELAGRSVELTVVCAMITRTHGSYNFLLPVKAAGEALNMARLQYIIGHPAFFRKCLFGLTENAVGVSMNTAMQYPGTYSPEGMMHIGKVDGACETVAESLAWAEAFARDLVS